MLDLCVVGKQSVRDKSISILGRRDGFSRMEIGLGAKEKESGTASRALLATVL